MFFALAENKYFARYVNVTPAAVSRTIMTTVVPSSPYENSVGYCSFYRTFNRLVS